MRAWWWILITAHLVWGNPDRFKDDYGNTISLETNQNSETEEKVYPSFILSPNAFYARISSSDGDEREKKQLRFHSWGGKRYGDEEEEEVEDNRDTEENIVAHEQGDEDTMNENSSYPSSNVSHLGTDVLGDHFWKAFTKRIKSSPAFSSWGGKRDPEMMNDLSKRSNLYDPIFQQSPLDSKLEQSRKRYPSFSSWAGKRAAAFNSWAGKRDFSTENRDSARAKRDHSQAKIGFNDGAMNWVDLNTENIPDYTSFNSNSLDSENNLNYIQDHDPDTNQEHSSRTITEDTENNLPVERHVIPEYENPTSKRAAAFNSWGGKRMSEENTVMIKKPVSFNSWAGKRAAAFNSWGGKRAAAFNSWGGKRAAAFNSWGGKRAAAFNSWGGKRAAAFNSWGGKRAAAFNSWGGKRTAAFNSWGGKRAAAFNSWGGKRAAAFNSWGGKRDVDKEFENPKIEYPNWTKDRDSYGKHFPAINSHDKTVEPNNNEFSHHIDQLNTYQDYIFKHAPEKNEGEIKDDILKKYYYLWLNYKPLRRVDAEKLNSHANGNNQRSYELVGHSDDLEKRIRPSFTSWASKRSPLFSPWYGGKIPKMLLTSGKRRPAFSSWGGKRSEHKVVPQLDCSPENSAEEETIPQKPEEVHSKELSPPEKKTYSREKREVDCGGEENASALTIERDKRASGSFLKNRVFTRMMLQGGWPMAFQPMSHGKDFFAWGGKRSSDVTT